MYHHEGFSFFSETDVILELAMENTKVYLERLFNTLGYLKVEFVN